MTKTKWPQKSLPQTKNIKFIMNLEKQATLVFKFVGRSIIADVIKQFKKDKLAKSDKLPKKWFNEINKINIDVGDIVNPVMEKHMKALEWLLYGDVAGKEAVKAAKDVGIKAKALPGLLPSAYLQAIDTQRDFYNEVIGKEAPEIDKDLILESIKELMIRTGKFLEEFSTKFGNSITESLQKAIDEQNYTNTSQALLMAHEAVEMGATGAEALEGIDLEGLSLPKIEVSLKGVLEQTGPNWDFFVRASIGKASAVGTHTAMVNIYGPTSDQIKVVLMTTETERVCSFCNEHSRHPNGEYIYWNLSDFKPAGYNYGRKRKDWELCVPRIHPNCYCLLITVPAGFFVDKDHTLKKK